MAESEYIKVRVHGAQEVARIFQVPGSMIGLDSNVSYNGAEHQDLQYVKHTFFPGAVALKMKSQPSSSRRRERPDHPG